LFSICNRIWLSQLQFCTVRRDCSLYGYFDENNVFVHWKTCVNLHKPWYFSKIFKWKKRQGKKGKNGNNIYIEYCVQAHKLNQQTDVPLLCWIVINKVALIKRHRNYRLYIFFSIQTWMLMSEEFTYKLWSSS